MPLPGGPSDKAGNRYELRWIVRRLVDLVTGRLSSLRIEPPGEDAIEFRCTSDKHEIAYQVKRGLSGGGHWTLAALADVLEGFARLLGAEPHIHCVFASAHAAPELGELAERARASRGLREFTKRFLDAKWMSKGWKDLQRQWGTTEKETWSRLRRVWVATVGEEELSETTDTILQLLFDGQAEVTRAVLSELAMDSIHRELRAQDVVGRLAAHNIRRIATSVATAVASTFVAPTATGIRREAELTKNSDLLGTSRATVFIGGISGIGKSTVAAQFAAEWNGPVCWLDGALLGSGVEAIAALGQFLEEAINDAALNKSLPRSDAQVAPASRLAGKILAANRCLVVWDGIDGESQDQLRKVIEAVASTISNGGAQLVTAKETRQTGRSTTARMQVERLSEALVRNLVTDAFPDARATDVESAERLTRGHPYLLQLLLDAASILDLREALLSLQSEERAGSLIAELISNLPDDVRSILANLAWLDIPFRSTHVERLGAGADALHALAARHLVVRAGGDTYRVHELVANLIKASTTQHQRTEFHARAALLLRGIPHRAWLEVRAMLRHARAASMSEVAREAGSLLLTYAMDQGLWGLAREAAESLVEDSKDFYPHFVLGKCYRMTRDLEKALINYEKAEDNAASVADREMARYERASVLSELGRDDEAESLYAAMLSADEATTRAHVRVALGLIVSDRGERVSALRLLQEALQIASSTDSPRTISEAHHAIARVHIRAQEWEQARIHLLEAHSIRLAAEGSESYDVLGWFHLFASALQVERALRNRDGARNAAHSLWRCALVSGSVPWEANAAHALCLADPDDSDPEVNVALERLRTLGHDETVASVDRVDAIASLVMCEWSLKHYEGAVEAILELLALANEHDVNVPMFGHISGQQEGEESIVQMPGGYGLFLPAGEGKDFMVAVVTRVLERRPELAQHARMVIGGPSSSTRGAMGKKATDSNARGARKKQKRRRR